MINAKDIEKLRELLRSVNELPDQDLDPALRILDELLEVAKRNPEINISDEYHSLQSEFQTGEKKYSEWKLAKKNLAENIEIILNRFKK